MGDFYASKRGPPVKEKHQKAGTSEHKYARNRARAIGDQQTEKKFAG